MWKMIITSVMLFSIADSKAGGVNGFNHNVMRKQYHQLINYVKSKGTVTVKWNSKSGPQKQYLEISKEGGLIIRAKIYVGPIGNENQLTYITMKDSNLDYTLDFIDYTITGGESHMYDNPNDDASLIFWYMSLSTAIAYSGCCSK